MVADTTHHELIEACQRGEDAAFEELFSVYQDRVYSIALRYTGNPAVAKDLAQDTFLKLMSKIQQYRGEASFESWLYRMVANTCLDHGRRGKRLVPVVEEFLDAFRAPGRGALDGLLRAEQEEQVQQVVSRLAPEQRMVVILRYTEGLSYEEIAEALDISQGTVASRLNRAHKILERRLRHLHGSPVGSPSTSKGEADA